MLKSLKLCNYSSFGLDVQSVEFSKVNVIVGIPGSGKSNLLSAIHVMSFLLNGDHRSLFLSDFYHRMNERLMTFKFEVDDLLHHIEFGKSEDNLLCIIREFIKWNNHFQYTNGVYPDNKLYLLDYINRTERSLVDIKNSSSILKQRKDPERFPQLDRLLKAYSFMHIYRMRLFHRISYSEFVNIHTSEYLEEDFSNLVTRLYALQDVPEKKNFILKELQYFDKDVSDFSVVCHLDIFTLYIYINGMKLDAVDCYNSLLQYLCLLVILCNPDNFIQCIDDIELGLPRFIQKRIPKILDRQSQMFVVTNLDDIITYLSSLTVSDIALDINLIQCSKKQDQQGLYYTSLRSIGI